MTDSKLAGLRKFNTEAQRHRGTERLNLNEIFPKLCLIVSPLCASVPLCLCVEFHVEKGWGGFSSQQYMQMTSFPKLCLIVSSLCASVPLCLCVEFPVEKGWGGFSSTCK